VNTQIKSFQDEIKEGIPNELPALKPFDQSYNHAPKRKAILNKDEQKLALKKCTALF
jgi:urocanate hydratase